MILKDDINFKEAIFESVGLLRKTYLQILIFGLVFVGSTYLIERYDVFKYSAIQVVVLSIVALFCTLQLIVKVKSIYEKKTTSIGALLKESFGYIGESILAGFLMFILIFILSLVFALVIMILSLFSSFLAFLATIGISIIGFLFAFVLQGIVLGDLEAFDAITFSKDIFLKNFWRLMGVGILIAIIETIGGAVLISMPDILLATLVSLAFSLLYLILTILVSCVMFYQVTRLHIEDHAFSGFEAPLE